MFRNIYDLTKVFLISSFHRGENRKKKNRILKYLLYGFLVIYLAGICAFGSYALINSLIAIRQEEVFVALVLMAIITLVLFTTIVSCMNVLYFSDDNRFILPLPLKPLEVLSAKLNTLLIYVYMEEALLGLVPILMYGILTKQSFIYYPLALLVLMLVPIVPLLLVALIVMSAMAFTKGIRNKNLVQMVTMSISIVFSLLVSMISSSTSSQENVMALVNKAGGLLEIYKKAFVTMPMAIDALTRYSVSSLLLLAAISAGAYLLLCMFGQKVYYRGMLGSLYSSSGVSDKKIDEKTAYRSKGLAYTYIMKEVMVYLRRPTFFVQLVLPCLLLPAFMMVIMFVSTNSQIPGGLSGQLQTVYDDGRFDGIIYAIVLVAVMFVSMYSFMSTVAISKDGRDAYVMKYLPVPFADQLICKMIPDIVLCLFSYFTVVLVGGFLYKLPMIYLLTSLPVALSYSILHGFLILTDVRKPKLDWTNEMQIVKRNMRMMYSMGFSLINMGLVALLAFVLNLDMPIMMLVLSLFYLLCDYLLYKYIKVKDIRLADGFE